MKETESAAWHTFSAEAKVQRACRKGRAKGWSGGKFCRSLKAKRTYLAPKHLARRVSRRASAGAAGWLLAPSSLATRDGSVMASPRGRPWQGWGDLSYSHDHSSSSVRLMSHHMYQNTVCVLTHASLMPHIFSLSVVCCCLKQLLARETLVIQTQLVSGQFWDLTEELLTLFSCEVPLLYAALGRRMKKGALYVAEACQSYRNRPQCGSWCSFTISAELSTSSLQSCFLEY